jgi:hypothetical protein
MGKDVEVYPMGKMFMGKSGGWGKILGARAMAGRAQTKRRSGGRGP